MAHRSHARWLAPIVLAGAAAVVVWVSASTLQDPSSTSPTVESSPGGPSRGRTPSKTTTTRTTSTSPARTYTVRQGDFLSTVSQRTGVSVDRLRELNPGLDANALRVGQKIRLAPAAPR